MSRKALSSREKIVNITVHSSRHSLYKVVYTVFVLRKTFSFGRKIREPSTVHFLFNLFFSLCFLPSSRIIIPPSFSSFLDWIIFSSLNRILLLTPMAEGKMREITFQLIKCLSNMAPFFEKEKFSFNRIWKFFFFHEIFISNPNLYLFWVFSTLFLSSTLKLLHSWFSFPLLPIYSTPD